MKRTKGFEPLILIITIYVVRILYPLLMGVPQGVDSWFLLGDAKELISIGSNHGFQIFSGYNERWPASLVLTGLLSVFASPRFIGGLMDSLAFLALYSVVRSVTGPKVALSAVLAVAMLPSSALFGVQVTKEIIARPVVFALLMIWLLRYKPLLLILVPTIVLAHHLSAIAWGVGFIVYGLVSVALPPRLTEINKEYLATGIALLIGEYSLLYITGGFTFIKGNVEISQLVALLLVTLFSSSFLSLLLLFKGKNNMRTLGTILVIIILSLTIVTFERYSPYSQVSPLSTFVGAAPMILLLVPLFECNCERIEGVFSFVFGLSLLTMAIAAFTLYPILGPSTVVRLASMGFYVSAIAIAFKLKNWTVALAVVSLIFLSFSLALPLVDADPINVNLVYWPSEVDPIITGKSLGLRSLSSDIVGNSIAYYVSIKYVNLCISNNTWNIIYISKDNLLFGCREFGYEFPLDKNYFYKLIINNDVIYNSGRGMLVYVGG